MAGVFPALTLCEGGRLSTKHVYKLKEPLEWGSETITELEFRKPTIGDIKSMKLDSIILEDILKLASKLSTQSQNVIDRLSIEDGMGVAELLGNFLNPSRETGKAQSEP